MINENLEKELIDLFNESKKGFSGLHNISITVATYSSRGPCVSGFWHVGEQCNSFNSLDEFLLAVSEAKKYREKNELLFRKF